MATLENVLEYLYSFANPSKIPDYKRFFKTGKGEYGEGDEFLGVSVPNIRKVVKRHRFDLEIKDLKTLLDSEYHEERMLALLIMVAQYKLKRVGEVKREEIYNFYIKNTHRINNWDLVDVTAPHIVGCHLINRDRSILYEFAKSNDLWKKRIAIVSTFAFINAKEFEDIFSVADILLNDEHDLIHKAVGWAIRNVGIKDLEAEIEYLNSRYKKIPRTMLRYAIEKFDEELRQRYLQGEI